MHAHLRRRLSSTETSRARASSATTRNKVFYSAEGGSFTTSAPRRRDSGGLHNAIEKQISRDEFQRLPDELTLIEAVFGKGPRPSYVDDAYATHPVRAFTSQSPLSRTTENRACSPPSGASRSPMHSSQSKEPRRKASPEPSRRALNKGRPSSPAISSQMTYRGASPSELRRSGNQPPDNPTQKKRGRSPSPLKTSASSPRSSPEPIDGSPGRPGANTSRNASKRELRPAKRVAMEHLGGLAFRPKSKYA